MLFSDIENFAGIAQELPTDKTVKLMGIYLTSLSEVLRENEATLDKFVGDGIVAMFGMPVVLPNHAAMACQAALRMQERCATLRREWQASGEWPASVSCLHNRIGVHTGQAVVGNFGSAQRFNYTMIGDSVNLASRMFPKTENRRPIPSKRSRPLTIASSSTPSSVQTATAAAAFNAL